MKFYWLLLSILIFWSDGVYAQSLCRDIFKSQSTKLTTSNELETTIKRLEIFSNHIKNVEVSVSKEDIKAVSGKDSPIKAVTYLGHLPSSFFGLLWGKFITETNKTYNLETPEMIARLEPIFETMADFFSTKSEPYVYAGKTKKQREGRSSKIKLVELLKLHSQWLSIATGRDINLLDQNQLIAFFEAATRNEMKANARAVEDAYNKFTLRIAPYLAKEKNENTLSLLILHFFGSTSSQPFTVADRGFFTRNVFIEEAAELIKMLRMDIEKEEGFLKDLYAIHDTFKSYSGQLASLNQNRAHALLVMKAAEVANGGQLPVPYSQMMKRGVFDQRVYLALKNYIETSEYTRAILEEKLSKYVNESNAINARIEELSESIRSLRKRSPEQEKDLSTLSEQLQLLRVEDFNVDIKSARRKIFQIEVEVDQAKEILATRMRREAIEDFVDLNNRWQRLIPDKPYRIDGIDYSTVVFTKDVIDYFERQPVVGARYLAALSKSYVAIKKESGLRRLPTIHPQMRDIKIIRAHGKIRIVGKLIDGQLTFFHVYHSEKPYDTPKMKDLIENTGL